MNKIVWGDYSYRIQHKLSINIRWKYSKKNKYKCNAILCTSIDITHPVFSKPHNHAGNQTILKLENFKIEIKNRTKQLLVQCLLMQLMGFHMKFYLICQKKVL